MPAQHGHAQGREHVVRENRLSTIGYSAVDTALAAADNRVRYLANHVSLHIVCICMGGVQIVMQLFRSRIFLSIAAVAALILIVAIYLGSQPVEVNSTTDSVTNEPAGKVVETAEASAPSKTAPEATALSAGIASKEEAEDPAVNSGREIETNASTIINSDILLISLLVFSFFALVISLWVNIYLLRWRHAVTAFSNDENSKIPSALLDLFRQQTGQLTAAIIKQNEVVNGLAGQQGNFLTNIKNESGETRSAFDELLDAFSTLQKSLSKKDAEIERLRDGYDTDVFRRFLSRFLRLEKVVGEEIQDLAADDAKGLETLTEIQILLRDALAECGLEAFSPAAGESIRDAVDVDGSKKRPAEHPDQVLTIAEVIEPGWRIRTPDGFSCVKEARVVVYVEAAPIEEIA